MRLSVCALGIVAVVGCYGNPRISGHDGGAGAGGSAAGAGGSGGDAGGSGSGGGGPGDGGPDGPSTTCDGTTLPAAARLLRPMRGAYTGSLHAPTALSTLRPTFTWAAVAPSCGAVSYQIQADDSCVPGALDTCSFASPE